MGNKQNLNSLDKFTAWSDAHWTHQGRLNSILHRQMLNLRSYVELFRKYPANSIEFAVEARKLFDEIDVLLDDFKDNNEDLMGDLEKLQDVIKTIHKEMLDVYDDEE